MKHVFIIVFLLGLNTLVLAQEPHFLQHDIGDANIGIPINRMLQDHQSMIWLGTDLGLSRYDGINLHHVILDSSVYTVKVSALMEDKNGIIWVGTASGKIYYLDAARKVHLFDIEEGNPSKSITSILQDRNDQIWFATYGEGVYVYTGKRLYNLGMDDGLAGNDIYAMTLAPSGEIWLGTDDGINICTFLNEKKTIRHFGLQDGLPDQIITAINTDIHGRTWIGTFENGIVYFDPAQNKIVSPFENPNMDEVTSIELFDGIELWIGTRSSGLWRYHPDSGFERRLVNFNSTYPGEISDLMTDVEGNIWVAFEEGILLSAFRQFETLRTDIGEIQTLFSDSRNQLWIGSKKGLYRVVEDKEKISSTVRIAPTYDFNITD